LDYLRDGDVLVVHSMDRLARNLDDLRRIVTDLTGRGVQVQFMKEGLLFTGEDSAMSKLLLSVMGAFAEFERALLKERQREGIAIAKRAGVYKGRKPSLTADSVTELRARIAGGEKKAALAREFGISRETLYQYVPVTT
jgi:DNA invertase Pin-like site-specific DNA recombinase